tara:strand:+ start:54892 stop:59181 length:4290 start_codon:yes stop_codon:yes gene_type:complete
MSKPRLEDFFPYYPDPHENTKNYNALIYAKHEYRRLSQDRPQVNQIYRNHQRLNQVHLGVGTPNRYVIMYESPGLGKTCSSIGIAETRNEWVVKYAPKNDSYTDEELTLITKPALIIAQNPLARTGTFSRDIIETCTDNVYMSKEVMNKKRLESSQNYETAKTNALKGSYEIVTHESFTGKIANIQNSGDGRGRANAMRRITQSYSGRVIIIDEAHEFKTLLEVDHNGNIRSKSGKKMYNPMIDFLDNIYGCVIVVMTATPLVNDIYEFPSIVNLALPKEERIHPDDFKNAIIEGDVEATHAALEKLLVPRLLGKVSRMKIPNQDSKLTVRTNEHLIEYPEEKKSEDKLWLSVFWPVDHPSNPQRMDFTYLAQINWSITTNMIMQDSTSAKATQADNIVWPNMTVGTDPGGEDKYIVARNGLFEFSTEFIDDFNMHLQLVRQAYMADLIDQDDTANAALFEERFLAKATLADMDFKDENYGTIDILTALRVIKTRYSLITGEMIEQILGLEYEDSTTGEKKYLLNREVLSLERGNLECSYIYNFNFLSGVIKDGLFLKMFGCQKYAHNELAISANGLEGEKKLRYAVVHGTSNTMKGAEKESASPSSNRQLIEIFNHPANKYGEYIKILIGTSVSAQGINLKNARQAHQVSRGWNEATNEQAEGRADRPGNSHLEFDDVRDAVPTFTFMDPETGNPRTIEYGISNVRERRTQRYLKLFRHVSYNEMAAVHEIGIGNTPGLEEISAGMKMYERAHSKYVLSIISLKIMEKTAYNLYLNNVGENQITAPPSYGFPADGLSYPTDYSTYNLFYSRPEIREIKSRARIFFKSSFRITISDMLLYLNGYHRSTVSKALTEMVNDNERFIDRHGMLNYLREKNDVLFLQRVPRAYGNTMADPLLNYYSENLFVPRKTSMVTMFERIEQKKIVTIMKELNMINPPVNRNIVAVRFSRMSATMQSLIVEKIINEYSHIINNKILGTDMIDAIFHAVKFFTFYAHDTRKIIHTFKAREKQMTSANSKSTIKEDSRGELRIYTPSTMQWRHSLSPDDITYIPKINEYIISMTRINVPNAPFYGTIEYKLGSNLKIFKIQEQLHIKSASQRRTKKGEEPKNQPTTKGQAAYSNDIPFINLHLYSVGVYVLCLLTLYPSDNNTYYRFTFQRLRKISQGDYDMLSQLGKDAAVTHKNEWYIVFEEQVDHTGMTTIHEINMNVSHNLNERWPYVPAAHRIVMEYTHVYPEIMGWIFENELQDESLNPDPDSMRPDILDDAGDVISPFYPINKVTDLWDTPILPAYPAGFTYYPNILESLPYSIKSKLKEAIIPAAKADDNKMLTAQLTMGHQRQCMINPNSRIMKCLLAHVDRIRHTNHHESPYVFELINIRSNNGSRSEYQIDKVFHNTFLGGQFSNKQDRTTLLFLYYYLLRNRIKYAVNQ